jgi:processive 1,2-diacylglycerol beta-glucosyltransferase
MYISDVSGHYHAAIAIEKALRLLQPNAQILGINAFNYTNPISEKIINRLYMSVIKNAPQIWNYLYDNPSIVKRLEKIKKTIHKFNSPKLKDLFEKFKPDVVACTQAFPCGMCADYKEAFNSDMPLVAVLTDYVPHSYWIYDKVDCYITPSEDVSLRLSKKGIDLAKIKALGIPFEHKFNEHLDKTKLINKLRLDPEQRTVLIMGGGQGLGPIKTIVKSLEKVEAGIQEIIVCGTNKKLYNFLKRKIRKYKKKILLFGFVTNIHELMSVSDMIISKPGGVTTAEVLAKNLPMIIVKPIPGQEENNTAYLTEKGAAIRVDKPRKISLVVEELLKNPSKLKQVSDAQRCISKPNASLDIARLILQI